MATQYMVRHSEQFDSAVKLVANLPKDGPFQPTNELKLRLYAYFKQATCGPCLEPKPGFWDPIRKAKWHAWRSLENLAPSEAKRRYVDCLLEVVDTMSYSPDVQEFLLQMNNDTVSDEADLADSQIIDSPSTIDKQATSKNESPGYKINEEITDDLLCYTKKQPLDIRKSNSSTMYSAASDEELYDDAQSQDVVSQAHILSKDFIGSNVEPSERRLSSSTDRNDRSSTVVLTDESAATISPAKVLKFAEKRKCGLQMPPRCNDMMLGISKGCVRSTRNCLNRNRRKRLPIITQVQPESSCCFNLCKSEKYALRRWRPDLQLTNCDVDHDTKVKHTFECRSTGSNRLEDTGLGNFTTDEMRSQRTTRENGRPSASGHCRDNDIPDRYSSSSSPSTTSFVEWDPQVGTVLLKMHNELKRINSRLLVIEERIMNTKCISTMTTGFQGSRYINWYTFVFLWPVVLNVMTFYLWKLAKNKR